MSVEQVIYEKMSDYRLRYLQSVSLSRYLWGAIGSTTECFAALYGDSSTYLTNCSMDAVGAILNGHLIETD